MIKPIGTYLYKKIHCLCIQCCKSRCNFLECCDKLHYHDSYQCLQCIHSHLQFTRQNMSMQKRICDCGVCNTSIECTYTHNVYIYITPVHSKIKIVLLIEISNVPAIAWCSVVIRYWPWYVHKWKTNFQQYGMLPHMPSFTASSNNCGESLLTIPVDN